LERRRARLAPRSTAPALNTDEIGIDAAESRLLRDLKDANRTAEHDDELHRLTERYEREEQGAAGEAHAQGPHLLGGRAEDAAGAGEHARGRCAASARRRYRARGHHPEI
jgi:hypothetical protein